MTVPVSATPRPKGTARPDEHPQREGAVDRAEHRVGEQILCVALRVRAVDAAEHPADVRVVEPAKRSSPTHAVIDVRAVGVAG